MTQIREVFSLFNAWAQMFIVKNENLIAFECINRCKERFTQKDFLLKPLTSVEAGSQAGYLL